MKNMNLEKYVRGRTCAILGLGVSNLPLARLLCDMGIKLHIYDKRTAEELGVEAVGLRKRGAVFHAANKDFDGIEGELIFRSPGIRPDVSGLVAAEMRGAELISEMELFLELTPASTYAVTGSDGKTTSTTLTGKFLAEQCRRNGGRTYVGGNIGTPLLDRCREMNCDDCVVLELSSFQLMMLKASPKRAAITNVSPNHLDWHRDMNEYISAKENIIGNETKRLVINAECAETLAIAKKYSQRYGLQILLISSDKHSFDDVFGDIKPKCGDLAVYEKEGNICVSDGKTEKKLLPVSAIRLRGKHNIENYMTAIGLTYGDVDTDIYTHVANSFLGVEHRLEWVRELNGVDYYNSSIDSSPTRTAAALSALYDRSIVLICGGYDKKIPYAPLAKSICEHGGVRAVVLTGATGDKIGQEIEKYRNTYGKGLEICIEKREDFIEAVRLSRDIAKKGDAVLLSPASASFDAFKNFAQRGDTFKNIVMNF